MNETKQKKKNFYLRFSDWMDGALWRRALVLLALSAAVITVFYRIYHADQPLLRQ